MSNVDESVTLRVVRDVLFQVRDEVSFPFRKRLLLPRGFCLLHIGVQLGEVCVWYLVDPLEHAVVEVTVLVVRSGASFEVDEDEHLEPIGTVLLRDESVAVHGFLVRRGG